LANGPFPKRREALMAIKQSNLLICCDGAYMRLIESDIFANAKQIPEVHVVGDGDSLSSALRDDPPFATTFAPWSSDQECNDLTKAVLYSIKLGVGRIVILGATGLREDHTLGNISLLAHYSTMKTLEGNPLEVRMYSDHGYFTPLHATATLSSFPRQQVSLFSLTPGLPVSVEGLRYPIERRVFSQLWEATLNESIGTSFKVILHGEGSVLVFQTHVAKN
nr:thiamine diphosphokinase [Bacteroidales bacterium]